MIYFGGYFIQNIFIRCPVQNVLNRIIEYFMWNILYRMSCIFLTFLKYFFFLHRVDGFLYSSHTNPVCEMIACSEQLVDELLNGFWKPVYCIIDILPNNLYSSQENYVIWSRIMIQHTESGGLFMPFLGKKGEMLWRKC